RDEREALDHLAHRLAPVAHLAERALPIPGVLRAPAQEQDLEEGRDRAREVRDVARRLLGKDLERLAAARQVHDSERPAATERRADHRLDGVVAHALALTE